MTVAVITPSIGRNSLEETILSVKAQTYPCKHYVFIDGIEYHKQAKSILDKYPDVIVTYLPMKTGENGWCNSRINAAAPFYVQEDIVCYLDDDNTYLPKHIEYLVEILSKPNIHYAYSFRNFVDRNGEFICQDRSESIGKYNAHLLPEISFEYAIPGNKMARTIVKATKIQLIDTNCYAFPRQLAQTLGKFWLIRGDFNDQVIFEMLNKYNLIGECSEKFTVSYTVNYDRIFAGRVYQQIMSCGVNQEECEKILKELLKKYNNVIISH